MLPWTTCGNSWNTPQCREFDVNITGGFLSDWSTSNRYNIESINQTDNDQFTGLSSSHLSTSWSDNYIEAENKSRYTSAASEYFK